MSENRGQSRSLYMEFAKLRASARFNLATSGIMNYPLAQLPVRIEDLEITGPSLYGYAPLIQRLAAKSEVHPECVVFAIGTSLANHLALAATTEHGDEILVEDPAYEPMITAARFLGLEVSTFPRRFEDGFRIEPREVERRLTSRTRLVMITNLHNPSGVLAGDDTLLELANLARGVGARLLVDEVYLDMAFSRSPRSSFHLSPRDIVVTTSLTKAYALSGLRCGWILAEPGLAERLWRINDLYGAEAPHAAERLSVIALDHLESIAGRSHKLLQHNRPLLERFLSSRSDLATVLPEFGTICFPRLLRGSVGELCARLREKYETSVVPGSFFGMPQHFRIGIGIESDVLAEGLSRLAAALDEIGTR
jgi:aspartate/methionine/tyrosine aminotransferase